MDIDLRACSLGAEPRPNKRKKDQSTASSVSKRQVLGEKDSYSLQGKANYASSSSGSTAVSAGSQDLPPSCENTYDVSSSDPFDIIVQKEKDNNNSSSFPIDPLAVGRLLYATNKNDILELKKIRFSKINIRFKTREAANRLISNQTLIEKRCHVYIPLYRTERVLFAVFHSTFLTGRS